MAVNYKMLISWQSLWKLNKLLVILQSSFSISLDVSLIRPRCMYSIDTCFIFLLISWILISCLIFRYWFPVFFCSSWTGIGIPISEALLVRRYNLVLRQNRLRNSGRGPLLSFKCISSAFHILFPGLVGNFL